MTDTGSLVQWYIFHLTAWYKAPTTGYNSDWLDYTSEWFPQISLFSESLQLTSIGKPTTAFSHLQLNLIISSTCQLAIVWQEIKWPSSLGDLPILPIPSSHQWTGLSMGSLSWNWTFLVQISNNMFEMLMPPSDIMLSIEIDKQLLFSNLLNLL